MSRRLNGGAVLVAAALLLPSIALAAYPKVKIKNNTEYTVTGTVKYISAFCKNDRYSVRPGGTWRGKSRGVCLIKGITGKIRQAARGTTEGITGAARRATPSGAAGARAPTPP